LNWVDALLLFAVLSVIMLLGVNRRSCAARLEPANARVRSEHRRTEVVVLTTYTDDESLLAALTVGAHGFLTKDADAEAIARALHAAAAGKSTVDADLLQRLVAAAVRATAPRTKEADGLTA
jgi:DNA-binding NarL/FixJ family response regulator